MPKNKLHIKVIAPTLVQALDIQAERGDGRSAKIVTEKPAIGNDAKTTIVANTGYVGAAGKQADRADAAGDSKASGADAAADSNAGGVEAAADSKADGADATAYSNAGGANAAAAKQTDSADAAADTKAGSADAADHSKAGGADAASDSKAGGADAASDSNAGGADAAPDSEADGADATADSNAGGANAAADSKSDSADSAADSKAGGADAAADSKADNSGGTATALEHLFKHPLESSWTLWFLEFNATKSWEDMQNEVSTFETAEDFWSLFYGIKPPSKLKGRSVYSVFKKGIRPTWEDERNKMGGRWMYSCRRNKSSKDIDDTWIKVLVFLISDGCNFAADICGAAINVWENWYKISIWTADGGNEESILEIGNKFCVLGELGYSTIVYKLHKDCVQKISMPIYKLQTKS